MKLSGRRAIITGANQGLGLAIAEAYVAAGAQVLLGARGTEKLEAEAARLRGLAKPGQAVLSAKLDVADEASVAAFLAVADKAWGGADVLVNNAGVYGPKGPIDALDWKAWVEAIQINLTGTVLCCRLALPLLRNGSSPRIINLSGGGATQPLPRLSAYAASKAAVVRFSETLAEELREEGISVNAVAPGALNTRLLDEVLEAGPSVVGEAFYKKSLEQKAQGGTPLGKGAELCAYLGAEADPAITGKLISAVWDPWPRFDELKEKLAGDIYTLRRIVPKERGMDF